MGMKKTSVLLLSFLVVIVYSNSLMNGWQFDDLDNIVKNPNITSGATPFLSIKSSLKGVGSTFSWYRPLSFISFALNWSIGGSNVVGFHLVNIVLHILCSIFLCESIVVILTISYGSKVDNFKHDIALLATTLWALHPIHVQAVTYIVQRMAVMSGLFYILSVLFYLKIRKDKNDATIKNWFLALFFLVLSFASKQNGILCLGTFVLIEFFFFRSGYRKIVRKCFDGGLIISVLLFFCFIVYLFKQGSFSYDDRSFNLYERLLTQSRLLWFYISQLVYPVSSRFSLIHDYQLSTSLFTPLSTFFSIVGLVILGLITFFLKNKRPVVSFVIVFFFYNHLAESTFIPLEMIFEHRNYVPSMFLFLSPCILFVEYLLKQSNIKKTIYGGFIVTVLVTVGLATYTRNFNWKTDLSLWENALIHAPKSARVHQNYAIAKRRAGFLNSNEYIDIMTYSEAMWDDTINRAQQVSLSNLIMEYISRNEYSKALDAAKRLEALMPLNLMTKESIVGVQLEILLRMENYEGVIILFDKYFSTYKPSTEKYYTCLIMKGIAYLKMGRFDLAKMIAIEALHIQSKDSRPYAILSAVSIKMKKFEVANRYLKKHKDLGGIDLISILLGMYRDKLLGQVQSDNSAYSRLLMNYNLDTIIKLQDQMKVWPLPSDFHVRNEIQEYIDKIDFKDLLEGNTSENQ